MGNSLDPALQPAPDSEGAPQWKVPRPADAYKIATEHAGGCVFARVSGRLSIDQFLSTLHILGIESEGWPEKVMLIAQRVTRISERSARRTGMEMSVFDCEVKALGWLAARDEGQAQAASA